MHGVLKLLRSMTANDSILAPPLLVLFYLNDNYVVLHSRIRTYLEVQYDVHNANTHFLTIITIWLYVINYNLTMNSPFYVARQENMA